jgi:hypothetical protein
MPFSASYYTQHPSEEKDPVSLDGISLEQFDGVVRKATISNQERTADAIAKADGFAWQIANPWYKRTDANTKLVNHWLSEKGVTQPMYADFADAAETLAKAGLLSVDEAAYASHLDGLDPKKFRGHFTKREYNNLDEMIGCERQAAIAAQATEKPTDFEDAFNRLSHEDAKQLCRDAEKQAQINADVVITSQNADSFLTLHAEFRDDTTNGKLMAAQLHLNGFKPPYTIEQYEISYRQLVEAGLVRQNPKALEKQQAAEVLDRAKRAVNTPGSVFDKTSEAEKYNLPMEELRRRAQGNFTGSDRF